MAERENLPPRRAQATLATTWPIGSKAGYSISYGCFDDGRVSEVFVATNKASNDAEAIARGSAIVLSIALQYGAPFEEFRSAVTRDAEGRPLSIVGHALDLVAADLENEGNST